MEKIPAPSATIEAAFNAVNESKQRATKSLLNNAGIFVGVFICFAVILISTNDVTINSFEELASLGLNFFLLLFCSYSMYISCSDSGMRLGLRSSIYKEATKRHETLKRRVVDSNMLGRLLEFCVNYVQEELYSARTSVLAYAGISYEVYAEKWLAVDKKSVAECTTLTEIQKNAIIKANKIRPIRLAPEMFMPRGKGKSNRSPIGATPSAKKGMGFALKLLATVGAVALTLVDFNPSSQSALAFVTSMCTNLTIVIINGFSGYRFGYENIVTDTVNYINDQSDMIERAIHYIEEHPNEQNQNLRTNET